MENIPGIQLVNIYQIQSLDNVNSFLFIGKLYDLNDGDSDSFRIREILTSIFEQYNRDKVNNILGATKSEINRAALVGS